MVGIWVIACIQEPSHHFLQTSRRLRIFVLVLRVVHFIRNNCLYFVSSALTFRDFVPRLELLSPFRDFLGI